MANGRQKFRFGVVRTLRPESFAQQFLFDLALFGDVLADTEYRQEPAILADET